MARKPKRPRPEPEPDRRPKPNTVASQPATVEACRRDYHSPRGGAARAGLDKAIRRNNLP